MKSANKMPIPLTICGFCSHFRLQLPIPQQLNKRYKCLILCLWNPQTFQDYAKTVGDSVKLPVHCFR